MQTSRRKTLPPDIKRFVEYKLEHLQETERMMKEYRKALMPSQVPSYSGMPGGGSGEPRPAENIAIKLTTDQFLIEAEKTVHVIREITDRLDPVDKKIVLLCYWKKSHSKEGAALACHLSKTAVYDRINTILFRIALELGYVNI